MRRNCGERTREMRLPGGTGVRVLLVLAAAGAVGVLAATSLGTHTGQRWAGQWDFVHDSGGVTGGFAFRHETDESGAALLQQIGGTPCPEPTDYFAGGYTVPDGTPPAGTPPPEAFVDTGKIRACVVDGDPLHVRGRYESNSAGGDRGDIDLTLNSSGTSWTGTFTVDGEAGVFGWHGTFDKHFDDGAEHPSDPPYGGGTTGETGTGTTTDDEEDPSELPETATVIIQGKQFKPARVTLTEGDVLKICNRDPILHRPFSLDLNGNRFTQLIKPNKCITREMRNTNTKPIAVGIFDDFHPGEKLYVFVFPDGIPEETWTGGLPAPPPDDPSEIEVNFESQKYTPARATAKAGATLVLCNLNPVLAKQFSFSRYNRFDATIKPGACVRRKLQNPSDRNVVVKIHDARYSAERVRLEITVRPE
jgi:hypothetical protein